MVFDGTINLGSIISTLLFIGTGLYFVWGMQTKLLILIQESNTRHLTNTQKFEEIKDQLKLLADTTLQLAKQEMRMNTIDDRLQELSNRIAKRRQGIK